MDPQFQQQQVSPAKRLSPAERKKAELAEIIANPARVKVMYSLTTVGVYPDHPDVRPSKGSAVIRSMPRTDRNIAAATAYAEAYNRGQPQPR